VIASKHHSVVKFTFINGERKHSRWFGDISRRAWVTAWRHDSERSLIVTFTSWTNATCQPVVRPNVQIPPVCRRVPADPTNPTLITPTVFEHLAKIPLCIRVAVSRRMIVSKGYGRFADKTFRRQTLRRQCRTARMSASWNAVFMQSYVSAKRPYSVSDGVCKVALYDWTVAIIRHDRSRRPRICLLVYDFVTGCSCIVYARTNLRLFLIVGI